MFSRRPWQGLAAPSLGTAALQSKNKYNHGLLKNAAGYITLERKNYQADAVKHFSKIDDALTY